MGAQYLADKKATCGSYISILIFLGNIDLILCAFGEKITWVEQNCYQCNGSIMEIHCLADENATWGSYIRILIFLTNIYLILCAFGKKITWVEQNCYQCNGSIMGAQYLADKNASCGSHISILIFLSNINFILCAFRKILLDFNKNVISVMATSWGSLFS